MAGNLLGERRYYEYIDDAGNGFKYLTDQSLGQAVGATENDTNPDLPRRFSPRILYAEGPNGERKKVIVPTADNTAYARNTSTNLTIDGLTFSTTGRRGEKVSFGANPPAAAP